jgi:hypothetical protein
MTDIQIKLTTPERFGSYDAEPEPQPTGVLTSDEWQKVYNRAEKAGVAVDRASEAEAAPRCAKQVGTHPEAPPCGGSCIRAAGHLGLCLCAADYQDVPGTCDA